LTPWAKGAQFAQNGGEKGAGFVVTGKKNSHFFVKRQIGMKFWQKHQ